MTMRWLLLLALAIATPAAAADFFTAGHVGKIDTSASMVTPERHAQLMLLGAGAGASGGGACAGFTPASLPSLVAWYGADSGVFVDAGVTLATNGQSVQQWNDQSGNGYNLSQVSGPSRPIYNTNSFNSSFKGLTWSRFVSNMQTGFVMSTLSSKSANSWFMVFNTANPGSAAYLAALFISGGSALDANGVAFYSGTTTALGVYQNGVNPNATVVDNAPYRAGFIFDGSNVNLYVNNVSGASLASTWTTDAASYQLSISGSGPGAASIDGVISEIVGTAAAISSPNRTCLDNYFKAKWGL